MRQDTRQAAPARKAGADAWAAYRIDDAPRRLQLLQQLRDDAVPVMLSAPQGEALACRLLSVDATGRQLGFGGDTTARRLQRLVQDDDVAAVAYLDRIRLQFELCHLLLVHGDDGCMLRAHLPGALYRFQRRDSWRLRTLGRACPEALLRHPSLPDMQLALRIVDLGNGGCALLLPPHIPPLQPGSRLAGVLLRLDAETSFQATLLLQHVSAMHGESAGLLLGCEFAGLDGAAQRALQRWIDRTQQRRRLLGLR